MLTRARLVAFAVLATALVVVPVPASADAKRAKFGQRTLVKGSHGQDVRVLQDFLGRAGFHTGIDGRFGHGTWRTVRRWERANELPVDGRVTRSDARLLRTKVEAVESSSPGGTTYAPVEKATLAADGTAIAPAGAPDAVKRIIAAGNEIHDAPYRYGGGHGNWDDSGYDCSGSMSYALHGADLLDQALDSTGFMSWGKAGKGKWVTTYAHGGHAYMVVAGLRFDTSAHKADGSRWTTKMRSSDGYTVRHPAGL